jgi:hypothetical protein
MTLAALAAEVAAMHVVIDERDRRDAEVARQALDLLARQALDLLARRRGEEPVPEPPVLRVINGAVKRRTARRGQLRLVS